MYLIEELLKYKALVSWLKQHEFYEYDVDYDWDENPGRRLDSCQLRYLCR